MPGMTLKISPKSPLYQRIKDELQWRITMSEKRHADQHEKWYKAEMNVNAYVEESADDATRRADRDAGSPKYTTIKIPYTYALLMSAHTYWTSVFFARAPIHQFGGRHGESETAVQALEALISYQTQVGLMTAPYYLWLYDAGKYGVGILGTYWDKEINTYSQLAVDPMTGQQMFITNSLDGYEGNKVYNVSPWDFLPDPRVPINRFQEGEFVCVYRTISWNVLVQKESQNYYTNLDAIKKDSSKARIQNQPSWMQWPSAPDVEMGGFATEDGRRKHPAWIGAYEVYITLIPNEWGLGDMKMPEKWVFTITSDKTTIIQAQPLGAMHNRYPFDVLEPEPEAYALWNRGIPETVEPLQNTMDWLINSHFYNVRAIANGRFVADPSRIDISDLEEGTPGWIAMLKPEAWGTVTDIRQVFQQIDTRDTTSQHMVDFERMFSIGERCTGINEQIMGALSGGRKTATEVRTATGFGVNRLKTCSEYMSAVGMATHSQKLVQNTQQYMSQPMKVKLVGDLAKFGGMKYIMADPQMISGFYDFVPVDGTLPVDRFAQATLWKDLLGQVARVPQVMAQYDLGKIFAWVATLSGVKNMDQFRVEVAPNDVLAQQAQAGNVVPFQGGGGPGPQTNVATTPTTNVGGY